MNVMALCGAYHAPFLSDAQWPARRIFEAYLGTCAAKAGRTMPGPNDIDAAHKEVQHQHPRPHLSKPEAPNDGNTKRREPALSDEARAPPTILLLPPDGHKHASRTVQRNHTPWSIPKQRAPETDVPPSDRMTKAYHACADTVVRRPSTPQGPYCTSSPPAITPPPPPPLTSRHGSPPGFTRYPQAALHA